MFPLVLPIRSFVKTIIETKYFIFKLGENVSERYYLPFPGN